MSQRENQCRSANCSDESLRLLCLRLGTLFLYVLFHVIPGYFPGLIRIVFVHALERLQRIGSEILFVNDSVWANDKCHDSSHPILSRRSGEGEPADHCAANSEVHLSQRRRGSLSFQHVEVITVIRFTSLRGITFLKRFGHVFANRTCPSPIWVLPRQTVMFPGRADDALCVLVHLRTIMFVRRMLVLRVIEATTNLNSIQFVRTHAPIQYFLTAYFRIKKPLSFLLHER